MNSTLTMLPNFLFIKLSIIHYQLIFPHFSKKAGFFAASRKRFFPGTKPLILLAETTVKYINVKYVFLTEARKNPVFEKEGQPGAELADINPSCSPHHGKVVVDALRSSFVLPTFNGVMVS